MRTQANPRCDIRFLAGCLVTALLVACGGNVRAPVEDRNAARAPQPAPVQTLSTQPGYTVQRGDTLYSIAFRYGLDYRRLAAANKIPLPYTIYPGQRLVLLERDQPAPSPAPSRPTTVAKPAAQPAAKVPTPAAKKAPAPPPAVTKASSTPAKTGSSVDLGPVRSWRWPSDGQVIRHYSATVHKGIDIGGARGDPVIAVAAGQVVYAGTGIVGLGELLIIKHNEQYLSAYGHNERLLVGEGDSVSAGQKIAEKGSSGTDSVRLHFEIRREGKPIDPLGVLPRR
ncbi:LysM peptidoglycan-binding domain-containing protein [Mangrovimicrobium sediminis]|uniref:LysM peptidoglycan-binding domain-containing protein n=1 Tax=Mangrovimicrobium sediminis TaxID=2562682 RepID=A0A4Z0M992_9GAMM|nr:peptidoglycan DD-metalloendopeptidase family protein [Haliea sp. SAOS-164]TGD76054.1 LysM peptidoglycan-binding domain-containing protein [Haliea sp. SAOS-164]